MAVSVSRLAVTITYDGPPDLPGNLDGLGIALWNRFDLLGQTQDVEDAVVASRRAVELVCDGHPSKPSYLHTLALALESRFDRLGNPPDIADAIAANTRSVELTPDDDARKAARLSNLGNCLGRRFKRLGNLIDVEDSVKAHQRAVELISDGHPEQAVYLTNLGISLATLFWRFNDINDIERSIAALRQARELMPNTHPGKPLLLSSLGFSLDGRFIQHRDLADVDDAIEVKRRAVQLTPDGDPSKPTRLSSLGSSLQSRFNRLGRLIDIEEALAVTRRAATLTPDDHPSKPARLNSLGTVLITRFEQPVNMDIDEFVQAGAEDGTGSSPLMDGHQNQSDPNIDELKRSLANNFGIVGSIAELNEAIEATRHATDLTPPGDPNRLLFLETLGRALELRFKELDDTPDFQASMRSYMQAAAEESAPPSRRLRVIQEGADFCWQYASLATHDLFIEVYKSVISLLPQVAWLGYNVSRRYNELVRFGDMTNAAAAAAIAAGQIKLAVEWLEAGRSLVWGQLSQLRMPLDELQEQYPELAERLRRASRALESTDESPLDPGLPDIGMQQAISTIDRRQVAEDYKQVLAEIRKQAGFESFLLPKKLAELVPAAGARPVVLVNTHKSRCDAIILHSSDHVVHVPLPKMYHGTASQMRSRLVGVLDRAGVRDRGALWSSRSKSDDTLHWVLENLWKLVVSPVLQAMENEESSLPKRRNGLLHITWCATSPLAFLPFHAAGIYGGPGSKAEPTAKTFHHIVSSYAPSLSSLSRTTGRPGSSRFQSATVLVVSQPQTPGYNPIPGTMDEALKIGYHFPADRVVHLSGAEATTTTVLKALDERQPQIFHLACHGIQDRSQPANSAFVLEDGRLTLASLMIKSTNDAELAFLSACQTATGYDKLPDEAVHLAAGMLAIGYRSVIGTMWSIGDSDAPLVADEVYAKLMNTDEERAEVAYALHEAIGRLRSKVGEADFLRWVPFVHFGL
ncbi:CHAT domain-containing protein [Vararia minispora EC-137]|uniref:CHAT domain-containing protein n=1 Tax=Vararia minispora EC-137 TaxID=1314806 RepID=A0ACB8QK07_9AGAM|nr:CHAT domain-containing protein [Vararia minispora EC-137]